MTLLYLALAILFEVAWAIAMKLSDGFTRRGPAAVMFVTYVLSIIFLTLATRKLDIGVGYAIWAGCGMALIALIGVVHFKEPITALRVVSLLLIIAGVTGMSIARGGH